MELPRTTRKIVEIDVSAVLPSGAAATLSGVQFGLCDHGGPTPATAWVAAATWDNATRVATLVLAGREATNKTGALAAVQGMPRAELWALPSNGSIVDAGFVDTVECL
jgi:hypothetical protein